MNNAGFLLLLLPLVYLRIAQAAKRCHDLGKSGWWQIVPFYGIALLFIAGDYGPNEYGNHPKGMGNDIDNLAGFELND